MQRGYKQPVSVLVVIHNLAGEILLLERADRAGFWQSVTGSLEKGENPFLGSLARSGGRNRRGSKRSRLARLALQQRIRNLCPLAPPLCARRHPQPRTCVFPVH